MSLEGSRKMGSVVSYHSDPEPEIYSSDETRSEVTISVTEMPPPDRDLFADDGDDSTLSSSSSVGSPTKQKSSPSRGRRGQRSPRKRRRRQHSPLGSIKSGGSLMGFSIVEETDQDIMEESSVGEVELGNAYSLKRTVSAPEARGRSFERRSSRRVRRSLSNRDVSPRQVGRRPKLSNRAKQSDDISSIGDANSAFEPYTSREAQSPSRDEESGYEADVLSLPARSLPNRSYEFNSTDSLFMAQRIGARSLSPSSKRGRKLKAMEWKYDSEIKGAIHADTRRVAVAEDDSSGASSSACSKLSKRAREFRIRRLQRQKGNVKGNATEIRRLRRRRVSRVTVQTDDMSDGDMTDVHTNEEGDLPVSASSVVESLGEYERGTSPLRPEDELPMSASSVVESMGESKSGASPLRPVVSYEDEELDGRYESFMMDDLDLQLIEVRRPIGAEYGADEGSL